MWHHLYLLFLRLHIKISIKIITQVVFGRCSNIFKAVFTFYSFYVIHENHHMSLNWVWRYPNLLLLFIIHVKIYNKELLILFLSYLLIKNCHRSFKWMWHVSNFLFFLRLYIKNPNKISSCCLLCRFSNIVKIIFTFDNFCTPKTTQKSLQVCERDMGSAKVTSVA